MQKCIEAWKTILFSVIVIVITLYFKLTGSWLHFMVSIFTFKGRCDYCTFRCFEIYFDHYSTSCDFSLNNDTECSM